jgi:UDP-GlcNAc:undecaprenyl-phosphate/decaprenyl-phosphate GlcNAc-1-phosphate transferase
MNSIFSFTANLVSYNYLLVLMGLFFSMLLLSSDYGAKYLGSWLKDYDAPQRIHDQETSRLGGLIMLLGVIALGLLSDNADTSALLLNFFIALSPLITLTLLEDFHINTNPIIRLAGLFLSACLVINLTQIALPVFSTPYLSLIFSLPYLNFGFYVLCIVALINGMNFIDGTNGNMSFTMLGIFSNLLFLGTISEDTEFIKITIIFMLPLLVFVIFNYPWGKIFAGDLGAYFYGAVAGFMLIYYFGKNPDISTWNAVLVVFYPTAEIIYSVLRKLLRKKSPFLPDRLHLHIKLHSMFYKGTKKKRLSNSLVTIMLAIFWIAPAIILPVIYSSHVLLAISVFLLLFSYVTFNFVIPETEDTIGV